jgi:hypothetical protein
MSRSPGFRPGPRRLLGVRDATWSDCAQHAGWIAGRYAVSRNIFGHNATRANGAAATNANARKNYHAGANPHVILDQNWCGRRRRVTLFEAMLVFVHDSQVMTKQTVAPDANFSVRSERRAVVDEGVLAYRDMRSLMGHDFDRYDRAHQANAVSKFNIPTSSEINPTVEAHRPRHSRFSAKFELSVEESDS